MSFNKWYVVGVFSTMLCLQALASFSPVVKEARKQLATLEPYRELLGDEVMNYQVNRGSMPPADQFILEDVLNEQLDPNPLASISNNKYGVIIFQFREKKVNKMSPLLRKRWIRLWPILDGTLGTIDGFVCTTNLDDSYKMRKLSPGEPSILLGEDVPGFEGCE